MMLTTKGRYAVTAMVDLARNSGQKPVSLADIALRQGITVAYLEQIFAKMKRSGLVKSIRGPGGGYVLARRMDEINIAEIVIAAEESIKMTRCSSEGCAIKGAKCLTHDLWDGLGKQIKNYLEAINLEAICSAKSQKECGDLLSSHEIKKNEYMEARA